MEQATHLKTLSDVLSMLEPLDSDLRRRVIDTVLTYFADDGRRGSASSTWEGIDATRIAPIIPPIPFSTKTDIAPKDFLLQKSPKTDVERIACLGFYLTQFRGVSHFKTSDLTSLNTEAAQPKFSNAAKAVANATQYGYLAPAIKGNKQISAQGEQFVIALPDREAAKIAMTNRPKRSRGRTKTSRPQLKQPAVVAEVRANTRRVAQPRKG